MTGTFRLALDTHAPVVTFGDAGNTTAGELLTVLYTVNEPGVISASIELADGRTLAMDVASDRLTVLLPPDTPDGWATVTAVARDVVHNQATYTVRVLLSGTVIIPPPPPSLPPAAPGYPAARRPATTFERRRDHAVVRTSTRTRIRAEVHVASDFRLLEAGSRVQRSMDRAASEVTAASQTRTRVRRRSASTVETGETTAIAKRPEGPRTEDELWLLGLL